MPVFRNFSVFCQRFTFYLIWLIFAPLIFFPLSRRLALSTEALSVNHRSYEWASKLLLNSPKDSDTWEIAGVRFLTPYRSRRDLADRDFHILELTRPAENSTLRIHLARKPEFLPQNFRVVVHDGDEVKERYTNESVYSGEVHYSSGDSTTARGRAALSVCNDNRGFCGLIVTDKEHLIIQPHPGRRVRDVSPGVGRNHAILRVDESIQTSTCQLSDEIRVPLDKLKAAAALSSHEEHVSSSRGRPNHAGSSLSSSLLTPLLPSSDDLEQSYSSVETPLVARYDYLASGASVRPVAAASKVVEIAVFTDEDLYLRLRKKYPKDPTKKIKDYVITMINAMDLLYQHQSLGVGLEFRLVHLEIMKKYPSKLNKHGGRAMKYLGSFCDFAGEKNVNGDMWDHALLLTGMDLREDETSSTAGLAWAGTMCYRYYSCSISEGHSFGAAYIITHEIGHSLGMEHDGHGVSKSCNKEKFIMSPTTGPGKIEWSPCSKQNLKDFLQYGTSELRNTAQAHRPSCLSYTSMRNGNKIETSDGGQKPGQKFDASQQCKLAVGLQFRPVLRKKEPPFDNICWMLYCGNGTHAISTHPALEGTKCDDTKYCHSGKCVNLPASG